MIESCVNDMDLSDDKQNLMYTFLILGYYLQNAAQKEKDPEQKRRFSKDLRSCSRCCRIKMDNFPNSLTAKSTAW